MTRAKTRAPLHKPVFDAEAILRFAAPEVSPSGHDMRPVGGDTGRISVTLQLKSELVTRLKAEAARKEKTIEQVVEKLITKQLGKH